MSEATPSGADGGLSGLARACLAIAAVALVGMVLIEAWQVFARYVLNDSPGWTEPVAVLLLNSAMMFGAAAGVRADSHFGFFIMVHAAPPRLQRGLRAFAGAVALATGAVLAGWGGVLLVDAWDIPMAGTPLPQGLAFAPLAAGGALIALFALERLVAELRDRGAGA